MMLEKLKRADNSKPLKNDYQLLVKHVKTIYNRWKKVEVEWKNKNSEDNREDIRISNQNSRGITPKDKITNEEQRGRDN